MTAYRDIFVDSAALPFILECLELGHTLSRYLRERDLARGRVKTRLPEDADTSQLMMFEWGAKLKPIPDGERIVNAQDGTLIRMTPVPSTNEDLVLIIQDFLRRNRDGVFMIENWLARRSDPELSRRESRVVTFEDEVYTLVCENDLELAAPALREAAVPGVFVAVLATGPLDLCGSPERDVITTDMLAACAAAAQTVIVGAYDGEAYLFWTPT